MFGSSRAHGLGRRGLWAWLGFTAVLWLVLAFVLSLVAASPSLAPDHSPSPASGRPPVRSSSTAAACTSSVRGVVPGRASVKVGFLPPGFRLTDGNPADITAATVTYSASSPKLDPPRFDVHYSVLSGPLNAAVGGRSAARTLVISGHAAILEDGPPDPQFIGVYWKPDKTHLLSVVGYKMRQGAVIRVARGLGPTAQGPIELPLKPGPIVSRQVALAAAHRALGPGWTVTGKLSSWTETEALLASEFSRWKQPGPPKTLTVAPWMPLWTMKATDGAGNLRMVGVGAQSGRVVTSVTTPAGEAWFTDLTDRDPSLGNGCPGGSLTRIPFGVLTRAEESYTIRFEYSSPRTTVIQKLTTIPTLNRVDPALYGGCTEVGCHLDGLVWPQISVTRAPKGKLIRCPLNDDSHPPGVHYPPTRVYYSISVPDNYEAACKRLPNWVWRLTDLAPAGPTAKGAAAERRKSADAEQAAGTTVTLSTVSQATLSSRGIILSAPADGTSPATPAAEAGATATSLWGSGATVREQVLAVATDTHSPVLQQKLCWVVSVMPENGIWSVGGRRGSNGPSRQSYLLVFIDAQTGTFIYGTSGSAMPDSSTTDAHLTRAKQGVGSRSLRHLAHARQTAGAG